MMKQKSELELMREQLAGARTDLWAYRKYEGQSPVIDANIRHKEQQVAELDRRVRELEQKEREEHGEQVSML